MLGASILRLEPRPRPGLSCSGFRPTGVLEGATGLPMGFHKDFRLAPTRSKLAPCTCKGFSTGNLF
jgi:hypothetical protein